MRDQLISKGRRKGSFWLRAKDIVFTPAQLTGAKKTRKLDWVLSIIVKLNIYKHENIYWPHIIQLKQTSSSANGRKWISQRVWIIAPIPNNPAYGQHLTLSYVCDSRIPILNHESKSIPWVLSIPWVHVYSMSTCQYHESMSIPWVLVNSKN